MKKIHIYMIILLIGLSIFGFVCLNSYLNQRKENERLQQNIISDRHGVQYYWSKSGQIVAKVLAYEAKQSEINTQLMNDLKINKHRVESYTQGSVNTTTIINTHLRDSTIYTFSNQPMQAKVFTWSDKFNRTHGTIYNDSISMINNHYDSLTQVIYRGDRYNLKKQKKVAGWKFWQPRILSQVLTFQDTNSHIKYLKFITITKN